MSWSLLDQAVLFALGREDLQFLADWFAEAEWHEPPAKLREAGWTVSNA